MNNYSVGIFGFLALILSSPAHAANLQDLSDEMKVADQSGERPTSQAMDDKFKAAHAAIDEINQKGVELKSTFKSKTSLHIQGSYPPPIPCDYPILFMLDDLKSTCAGQSGAALKRVKPITCYFSQGFGFFNEFEYECGTTN